MSFISRLLASCFPSSGSCRVQLFSKAGESRTPPPCRRFDADGKGVSPYFVINWIPAKINSFRVSREEQAKFKASLNDWVKAAPEDLRGDYQKVAKSLNDWVKAAPKNLRGDYQEVAKKIATCFEQKTCTLIIDNSKCYVLPPIPDHVTHLKVEGLSNLTKIMSLPLKLERLYLYNTPHANLPKVILQLPRDAALRKIYINNDEKELSPNLVSESQKKGSYDGPPIEFFSLRNLEKPYVCTLAQEGAAAPYQYSSNFVEEVKLMVKCGKIFKETSAPI